MGSAFGGTTTSSTKTKTDMGPWKDQAPYLSGAFKDAQDIYNSQKDTPFYQGQLYAGINGMQTNAADTSNANGGAIAGAVPGMVQAGMAGVNGFQDFTQNAGALANGNFNHGSTMANGTLARNTGYALSQGNRGLDAALSTATGDPTAYNINAANQYAHNPVIDGQIDAALTDVRRNLGENVLPQNNATAIATGNMNSSRAGVAEGIAQRGAAETGANIAAGIRSKAYDTGLALSESGRVANMGGALSAAGQGYNAAGQGATGENNTNANRIANLGVQTTGTQMEGTGAQLGGALLGQGVGVAQGAGNLQTGAGALYQGDQQNRNQEGFTQWQGDQAQPWSPLRNLYGIVGSQNWGRNGTTQSDTTQSSSGNPLGAALGVGLGAASMFAGGGPLAGLGLSSIFSSPTQQAFKSQAFK